MARMHADRLQDTSFDLNFVVDPGPGWECVAVIFDGDGASELDTSGFDQPFQTPLLRQHESVRCLGVMCFAIVSPVAIGLGLRCELASEHCGVFGVVANKLLRLTEIPCLSTLRVCSVLWTQLAAPTTALLRSRQSWCQQLAPSATKRVGLQSMHAFFCGKS